MRKAMDPQRREEWLAERRDMEDAVKNALAEGVRRAGQRQGWTDWLAFAGRLPGYSFTNQLLLAWQLPAASLVMAASQWREVGRYPARGSRALRIYAPSNRAAPRAAAAAGRGDRDDGAEDRDAGRGDGAVARTRPRFVLVPVFDVSQTGGQPLPPRPQRVPAPAGEPPRGMWEAMAGFAAGAGYAVGVGDTGSSADGVTRFDTRQIVVADRGSRLAQTLVLAHELGHMALHGDPSERAAGDVHRGRRELEAESAAYMVAHAYDLHEAADWHFDYLAGWAAAGGQRDADVRAAADRVLSVARPLLRHLAEHGVGLPAPADAPAPHPPAVAALAR